MEEVRTITIPCSVKSIPEAKHFVLGIVEERNIPMELSFKLELSLDEAVMNAIDHGSALKEDNVVEISCLANEKRFIVMIKDFGGKAFNPEYFEKLAAKKTWGEGGRGIQLITSMMDEVMYLFNPGRSTTLLMAIHLDKPPEDLASLAPPDLSLFDTL